MKVVAQAIHASRPDPGRMLQEAMDKGAWPGPLFNRRMQHLSNELNSAVTVSRTFESVRNYNYERHRVKTNPVERLKEVFRVTEIQSDQITEYRNTRDYFTRLYNALREATIEHRDIASLWGDPYLELVKHWDRVESERRERLEKRYPETREITDTIDEARREIDLSRYLDTPAERFMNEVAIPVVTIGSIFTPVAPVTATSVARTAVIVGPKLVRVATALGATEAYRELTTFFNKKAGSELGKKPSTGDAPRVIPTHDMQRTFIESKVKSKEWTKLSGRMLYEDKAGYRYIPTKEKFEFEVGKKIHGKWTHIGILRGEGEEAGKILRRFGKGLSHGRYFE